MIPLEILPRAPIYGPDPIGVGTIDAESLSSYYLRLAAAHRVTPQQFSRAKPPLCGSEYSGALARLKSYSIRDVIDATAVCSPCGLSLANALGELTARPRIAQTTFEAYRGSVDTSRLIRRYRASCPLCLQDDPIPYERLLWCLSPVTDCQKHGIPLQTHCPHCRTQGERNLCQGELFRCGKCTKVVFQGIEKSQFTPCSAESIKAATILASFFEAIFEGTINLTQINLAADIRWFCGEIGAFSLREQALALGTTKGSLSEWYSGSHAPSLTRFLEMALHLGANPLQILRRETNWDHSLLRLGVKHRSQFWSRAPRRVAKYDKKELTHQILKIHNAHPTLGVAKIAQLLKIDNSHIRRLLRVVTRMVDRHAKQEARKIHLNHEEKLIVQADLVIKALINEGVLPTRKRVSKRMAQPGSMRNPHLRSHVDNRLDSLQQSTDQAA